MDFSTIEGVISDMDGVLWRGAEALPGLVNLFTHLRGRGIPFALATNNSARSQTEYVEKLGGMGVPGISEGEIVTSRMVLIEYLLSRWPSGERIYVIGSPGMIEAIAAAGYVVSEDADVVAVGIDRQFTYAKLARAAGLIRNGAAFLATNGDVTLPDGDALAPGAGSLLAAIAAASGISPVIMGKPSAPMFASALRAVGTEPARTLMLGDRLETDIAGAQMAGMKSALLLSGVTERAEIGRFGIAPDAVFNSLPEMLDAWQGRA